MHAQGMDAPCQIWGLSPIGIHEESFKAEEEGEMKRRRPDLPQDLPPPNSDIWSDMGMEFDDDDQMTIDRADRDDKERLEQIYREEDRIEFERLKKLKKHGHNKIRDI